MGTIHAMPTRFVLLVCSAALGFLISLVLITLERLKYPLAAYLKAGGDLSGLPVHLLSLLGATDYLLILSAVVTVLWVVLMEIRRSALSLALSDPSRSQFPIFAALLLAWFAHSYLHPGYLLGGDTGFHIARIHHFRLGLEQGKFIFWDNFFNIGVPELQFTGPLLFWTGGIIAFLLGDSFLAAKLLLFLLHVLAGWAVYAVLRRSGIRPFPALIGAAVYSGAWAHLQLFHYKGVLPQAYTLLFLPLGVLLMDQLAARDDHISPIWSALAVVGALAFINHPTNGLFIGIYWSLFALLSVGLRRYSWTRLWPFFSAGAAAIAMTCFIVVPVLKESQWVTMTSTERLIFLKIPDPIFWKRILFWHNTNTGTGANFDGYLGVTALILSFLGFWAAWAKSGRSFFRVASLMLAVSLVLTGPHVRNILFILFFMSLLAGLGTEYLLETRHRWKHLPAIILAFIFLDLGSTSIQPLARTDKKYLSDAAEFLKANFPASRVVQAGAWSGEFSIPLWGGGPFLMFPLQQMGLPHGYSATVFHNYGAVLLKRAEQDLATAGQLSEKTARWLAMLNISHIICDNGSGMGLPPNITGTASEGPLGPFLRIRASSPFVFSENLAVRNPDPDFDRPVLWDDEFAVPPGKRLTRLKGFVSRLLDEMNFDPVTKTANHIPIRTPPEQRRLDSSYQRNMEWQYKISSYKVNMMSVQLTLHSDRAGYIQLAHAWYPFQEVRHNGNDISPLRGTMNFLVLPVLEGSNTYTITPKRSPLRQACGIISAAIGGVVLVLGISASLMYRTKRSKPR